MRVLANQDNNVVFLLVEPDGITPASVESSSITVEYSVNCGQFAGYVGDVSSIGRGWYYLSINPGDAPDFSPLILTASAQGTLEWRDILEVSNPKETTQQPVAQAGQWYLPIGRFGVIR